MATPMKYRRTYKFWKAIQMKFLANDMEGLITLVHSRLDTARSYHSASNSSYNKEAIDYILNEEV